VTPVLPCRGLEYDECDVVGQGSATAVSRDVVAMQQNLAEAQVKDEIWIGE
jgi:hypothetical protein